VVVETSDAILTVSLHRPEKKNALSLAMFGFFTGIGAFLAPCAFALFPAYVSYYLSLSGGPGEVRRSLGLGLACARRRSLLLCLVGPHFPPPRGAVPP